MEVSDKMAKISISAVGDITLLQEPGKDIIRASWDSADIRMANLEAPFVGNDAIPADKLVRLKQPLKAGEWVKQLNPTVLSLANNHTMDWGDKAVCQTSEILDNQGIKHAGAGRNITEAIQPVYLEVDKYRIAFLSCSSTLPPGFQAVDNRPGIAGLRIKTRYDIAPSIEYEQPGTPPWIKTEPIEEDLFLLEKTIKQAQLESDFVILSIHWGVPPQWCTPFQGLIAEYQPIIAERVAKAGVDLIVGHHSHAPYGMETFRVTDNQEKVKDVPVLYSLGNYIAHYEHFGEGLDASTYSLPVFPPTLQENRQSCLAEIKLDVAEGKLVIDQIIVEPAILNDIGEAIEARMEDKEKIVNRIHQFSISRGAKTYIKDNKVIWKREV